MFLTETTQTRRDAARAEYRNLMFRELLIWLVAVPVPILAVIWLFVF